MASSIALLVVFTVGLFVAPSRAQFGNNFLLSSLLGETEFEGLFENGFGPYASYAGNQLLSRRIAAVERNVQTGATGGCESGVLGPFTPTQMTGQITFRGRFLTPPSVSLSVSDLQVNNAAQPLNFRIRPAGVTPTGASVTFTDNTNNVASAFVSYMVCPSNNNIPIKI